MFGVPKVSKIKYEKERAEELSLLEKAVTILEHHSSEIEKLKKRIADLEK